MADSKTIRNAAIAVWALAALVVGGLAFVSPPQAKQVATVVSNGAVLAGARPVMYEFSTNT